MSCRHPMYQWTRTVTTHFPHLSKPQAVVLALWSVGMVVARPGFSATTSPGVSSAFASLNAFPVPGPNTPLLTVSLTPGNANQVLAVEAMLTSALFAPNVAMTLHLNVSVNTIPPMVNPIPMEPSIVSPLGVIADCGGLSLIPVPPASCTVVGTWWLDLAAAGLVGKTLTVTLTGGNLAPSFPFPVDVTITVRKASK